MISANKTMELWRQPHIIIVNLRPKTLGITQVFVLVNFANANHWYSHAKGRIKFFIINTSLTGLSSKVVQLNSRHAGVDPVYDLQTKKKVRL